MSYSSNKIIPIFKVFMSENVDVNPVLKSGYIGQGEKVELFENCLKEYFSNNLVSTVNSATSGIHLALHMCKDGIRDEVLTTPLTCTATNFPIVLNNLKLKWVDLDPNTCNFSLKDLESKISEKTLAIIVVHWSGYPVDLNKLREIQLRAEEKYGHKIHIIEDCAHAMGSTFEGNKIGNHGNISVFSFQAIKHLTTGDGGAVISPNEEFHKRLKLLRWYGLDRESSFDFRCSQNIEECGFKFHMNDIAASIGIENIKFLEENIQKHIKNHEYLRGKLDGIEGLHLLEFEKNRISSSWIMTILVENRDEFMKKMSSVGVQVSRVHDRNDKHECLKEYKSFLPNTDYVCDRLCCIPCGWWLDQEMLDHIIDSIKLFYS